MYNSEVLFTEGLLSDWSARTENPWEAALFYVPTFTYYYSGAVWAHIPPPGHTLPPPPDTHTT